MAAVQPELPRRAREANALDEEFDREPQTRVGHLGEVRKRLEMQPFTAITARNALTALQSAKLQLPIALRELKQRHMRTAERGETRVTWHELLGGARIAGDDDLEALIGRLRRQVEPLLGEKKVKVVE